MVGESNGIHQEIQRLGDYKDVDVSDHHLYFRPNIVQS
jgi:hypothetical protein